MELYVHICRYHKITLPQMRWEIPRKRLLSKKTRYKKPLANTCLKRSKKYGTNKFRTEKYKYSENLTRFEILPKHKHRRT